VKLLAVVAVTTGVMDVVAEPIDCVTCITTDFGAAPNDLLKLICTLHVPVVPLPEVR